MTICTYDADLLDSVAASFDLREPNKRALEGLVAHIAKHQSSGVTVEAVTNLATGVGKTYLMAALIDYLAQQGVRNFLVVTPGRTIQDKTVANFDVASSKHIAGAEHRPFIFTPQNVRTANAARALDDPQQVKVGVFTIQSLLGRTKEDRKAHQNDENLGGPLYELLAEAEDLVVVADEHHIYRHEATQFSQALRELTPRALIGLTATPDKADYDNVVVEYTLGEAIADGYVKTPVIVYRQDGIKDESIQLADAVALLNRKTESYQRFVTATAAKPVNPAMFVVCESIEHAEHVASVLRGPGRLTGEGEVLVATSGSVDKELQALDTVEEADSPVRAIVSVNKLKEGWDVKRIAVIVALRKLASESLTEQILGRGLRLPFGRRTGFADVDQVDLVAHDSYRQLLAQKDLLTERVGTTHEAVPTEKDEHGATSVTEGLMPPKGSVGGQSREDAEPGPSKAISGGLFGGVDEPTAKFKWGGAVLRRSDEESQWPNTQTYPMATNAPRVIFPRLIQTYESVPFDLTEITEADARAAGRKYRDEVPTFLSRDAVEATRSDEGVTIRTSPEVDDQVTGAQIPVSVAIVRAELHEAIKGLGLVGAEKTSVGAARRIVDDFLHGAGAGADDDRVEWSSKRKDEALAGISRFLTAQAKEQRPPAVKKSLSAVALKERVEEIVADEVLDGHQEKFERLAPINYWKTSMTGITRFDARESEFKLAKLMDRDPQIKWWRRLESSDDIWLLRESGGKYYPDFIAIDTDGVKWLIEAKADGKDDDADVQAKRKTAEDWARRVRDSGDYGVWKHLYCTESDIKHAKGSWGTLLRQAEPVG